MSSITIQLFLSLGYLNLKFSEITVNRAVLSSSLPIVKITF